MYEITNRLEKPYSPICYIRCDWQDGTSTRASGVVVGYNDVLTALHAVFDDTRGGWATHIVITPAADTAPYFTAPYGSFYDYGTVDGRAANWDLDGDGLLTAAESQGDLALIGMQSRIGDITGWLPVSQQPNDFYGLMVGYPARGTGMMAESVYADASVDATVYDIAASLGPGASGGPLLSTDAAGVTSVVGVLSGGNSTESTYAGLFSADTWNWLQTKMAANDSLLGYAPGTSPTSGTLYTGTTGIDNFTGTAGRDSFRGYSGNDSFDGAGDIDTAIYSATRSTYQITVNGATLTVHDSNQNRDGTDTLYNVERLKFSDMYVAFDTSGDAGMAWRLYQAAFDRAPDIAGLGFHINDLDHDVYITTVAAHFVESPEFANTYGSLDNLQFVQQLYRNVLHREGEAAGVAYHVHDLETTHTRADVLAGFSESPENQAAVIGLIQGGMPYTL